MKRKEFSIITTDGEKTVNGLVSESFGIHKNDSEFYSVTHLNTGYRIQQYALQKQARDFINRLESEPILWGTKDVQGMCEYEWLIRGLM